MGSSRSDRTQTQLARSNPQRNEKRPIRSTLAEPVIWCPITEQLSGVMRKLAYLVYSTQRFLK